MLLNIITTVVIGLFFGMIMQSLIFLVFYIPLRSYAGGYHAKTQIRCFATSVSIILIMMILIKYNVLSNIEYVICTIISIIIIIIFAPVEDKNKPLDDVEHKKYKYITYIILSLETIVWLILMIMRRFSCAVSIAIIVESVMLFMGEIKNRLQQ